MADVVFGNPWHGLLSPDSISLEPGTPVDSITIDGTEYPVIGVSEPRVLGDTRYYCAPPYPPTDPSTPAAVTALDGTFKRDMILFSDYFRWSPISDVEVLGNVYEWLAWDSVATAWRKMRILPEFAILSTNPLYPSADGTTCVTVVVQRGDVFGRIDHDIADTPDGSPTWTTIDTVYIPYKYLYNNIHLAATGVYSPLGRLLVMDARRDGKRILLGIHSSDDWAIVENVSLRDAWEVVIADDLQSVDTTAQILPDEETAVAGFSEFRHVSDGTPFWTDGGYIWLWWVPIEVEVRETSFSFYASYAVSGYDKGGTARLMYYVKLAKREAYRTYSGDAYIGSSEPEGSAPDYETGPTEFSPSSAFVNKVWIDDFDGENYTVSGWTYDDSATLVVKNETGDEVSSIGVPFSDGASGPYMPVLITNNVASIEKDGNSFMRAAPGAADDAEMATPVYAAFDHRTSTIFSSPDPVGVV